MKNKLSLWCSEVLFENVSSVPIIEVHPMQKFIIKKR